MIRQETATAPVRNSERSFRPEIQGLRALAVLMVVSYHVWFGRVSGGVDVFLFISAFLMTLQFVKKHERRVRTNLLRHYLHVFWRLLPMAAVVIVAALAAGRLIYPATRWSDLITQGWSSLLYVENWTLKSLAVNYYADDHATASPFQHFWSLSIQGQVFILWPLIFLAFSRLARSRKLRYRRLLVLVFGFIFIVSLTFSIWYTATDQTQAYFDTFARLWEFALGSLLALGLKYLELPRRLRVPLGWAGVVMMLACGFVVDVQGAFPGAIALWPTLSAAAVIVAGDTGPGWGVDRILSSRPLLGLGGSSYALYLWHWPVLVFMLSLRDRDDAAGKLGIVVVLLSLVLAFASSRWVEKPLRSWKWPQARLRNAVVAPLTLILVAAIPLGAWQANYTAKVSKPVDLTVQNNPGAMALEAGYSDQVAKDAALLPLPEKVADDWVILPGKCEGKFAPAGGKELIDRCGFQGPANGQPATKTVLVLGHSHAEQMMNAIKPLATAENWNLVAEQKGGCPYSPVESTGNKECDTFNQDLRAYIQQVKPDLVITMATQSAPDSPNEELGTGFEAMVKELGEQGVGVLALRDNPRSNTNLADCTLKKGPQDPSCVLDRSKVLAPTPVYQPLVGKYGNLKFMDLSDSICLKDTCPPVIGNVRVYLDSNHLTGTYASTLSTAFEEKYKALYAG